MTENDAPESTRARIGFLSIITSSWLPVILAVDGGFQYKRPHLLGRSLCLVFLAPTAWRLTGSAIWRRGSANDCQRRRSSVGGFEVVKDSLSLSAVAHYMSGRPQWKQTGALYFLVTAAYVGRGLVSLGFVDTGAKPFQLRLERSLLMIGDRVKDSCVWLTSRWTSSRTIVRIRETNQSHPSGDATGTTFGSLANLGRPTLFCFISSI
ncbi:hypothetical protein TNCV_1388871 [Trichonephila clavipes]|nr:hypothetical protein TNCV_1388871 [Trichonephila clavipes]